MRKKHIIVLLMFFGFILVACGGKKEEKVDFLEIAKEKISERNYQMNVKILIYDELQSEIEIKIDGNKSMFSEGKYVLEYYVRDGETVKVLSRDHDEYLVSETNQPVVEKYQIFEWFEVEWFDVKTEVKHVLKEDFLEDIEGLLDFSEMITVQGLELEFNDDGTFNKVTFKLEENRDNYQMIIEFSEYGETTVTLPEGI